jgi:hypothetical protein
MKKRTFTDLLPRLPSAGTGAPLVALLAAMLSLHPGAAQAQGAIEAWVQRYNGPSNSDDSAGGIAVDTNGNVYVTGGVFGGDPVSGGSGLDYATIAYSSDGVPLWTNYYNGPEKGDDYAEAVTVDASGNVVVTGSSWTPQFICVVATISYSSAGVPLWTNRYNAPGNRLSYGKSIAADTNGNVVVMAGTTQSGADENLLVIKYSGAGVLLWAKTYSYGGGWSSAMAVDRSGNVVVTGCLRGGAGFEDYLTLKYSSAGVLLWNRRYNGPLGTGQDRANAVAVDTDGNVIVTGSSDSIVANYWEYATIKYSNGGTPLWTNRYNGPANYSSGAQAMAVDHGGNVFVLGSSHGGGRGNFVTIKYSNAGTPVWTNLYSDPVNGVDEPVAMAVDASGNVYLTGAVYEAPLHGYSVRDYVTLAYSSTGVPVWTNRYDGPGNSTDYPGALVVDAHGDAYVTGGSANMGDGSAPAVGDYATVKYVTPLRITRQPLSCTNVVGTTASFTVEAVGSLPLGYQWYRDGTNVLEGGNFWGVTTTNLLLTNVQLPDVCDYTVVVTNTYGSITSHVAHLTITVPPSAGRFSNLAYSPATGFSFIFRDATVGQQYRIQRSPSMAPGSWTEWQSFTYTEPTGLMDVGATGAERRFYRAVSP